MFSRIYHSPGASGTGGAKLPPAQDLFQFLKAHCSAETLGRVVKEVDPESKRGILFLRIAKAVARDKGDVEEVVKTLLDYKGRFDALAAFLDKLQEDNPYKATARAQIEVPLRREISGAKQGLDRLKVRADSTGTILTGEIYAVHNKEDPSIAPYYCGFRNLVTIFSTFSPTKEQRKGWAKAEKKRAEQVRQTEEAAKSVTFDELLGEVSEEKKEKGPQKRRTGKSLIAQRKRELIEKLESEIKKLQAVKDLLAAEVHVPVLRMSTNYVAQDRGGSFFGWFKRQAKKGELPDHIEAALQALSSPVVELSSDERRFFLHALLAYQMQNTYIRREVAIATLKKDFELLAEQIKDGSINEYLKEAGIEDIENPLDLLGDAAKYLIYEEPRDEVPVADVIRARNSADKLLKVRVAVNKKLHQQFSQELERALKTFSPLFKDEKGNWLDDSRKAKIPLKRLRQTFESLALSREDFYRIRKLLFLTEAVSDNKVALYESMDIASFKECVEGVVIAYRRYRLLIKQFKEFVKRNKQWRAPVAFSDKEGNEVSEDVRHNPPKNFLTKVEQDVLRKAVNLGKELRPIEDFRKNYDFSLPKLEALAREGITNHLGIRVSFSRRLSALLHTRVNGKPLIELLSLWNDAGVYEEAEELKQLYKLVRNLKLNFTAENPELGEIFQKAKAVFYHPLVQSISLIEPPVEKYFALDEYFFRHRAYTPQEIEVLRAIASFYEKIEEYNELAPLSKWEEFVRRFNQLKVLTGGRKVVGMGKFSRAQFFARAEGLRFIYKISETKEVAGKLKFSVINPEQLTKAINVDMLEGDEGERYISFSAVKKRDELIEALNIIVNNPEASFWREYTLKLDNKRTVPYGYPDRDSLSSFTLAFKALEEAKQAEESEDPSKALSILKKWFISERLLKEVLHFLHQIKERKEEG